MALEISMANPTRHHEPVRRRSPPRARAIRGCGQAFASEERATECKHPPDCWCPLPEGMTRWLHQDYGTIQFIFVDPQVQHAEAREFYGLVSDLVGTRVD